MNEPTKSKWYWRLLRRGLIGVAVLATLAGILVTEEDWRGKHDWDTYKRAAEAHGEHFAWSAFTPPTVPDDENFFAAPIVAEALNSVAQPKGSNTLNRLKFDFDRGSIADQIKQGGDWHKGTLTDLKQWQTAFRKFDATLVGFTNGFPEAAHPQTPAVDVLLALSCFDPALEELRQASERSGARLPLDYAAGFDDVGTLLPWLASTKSCIQFLQLRALAEVAAGQSDAALSDVKLMLRLDGTIRNQPYLISHLVRIAITAITLQPIYEGLAAHRWNDTQLAELDQVLSAKDFLSDFKFALRGERTCAIDTFEKQRLTRQMESGFVSLDGGKEMIVTNSLRAMPSAYFYQNELAFARMYETYILPLVDLTNRTVSVLAYRAGEAALKGQGNHWSFYTMQARMLFPAMDKSVQKFTSIQADLDLARVACALERYRLAQGEYPATLDVLAPRFIGNLPHDIINGQPLRYRRTDDGRFVLYSVGWNEKDDGGTVTLNKSGSVNREAGDWVWQYPAK